MLIPLRRTLAISGSRPRDYPCRLILSRVRCIALFGVSQKAHDDEIVVLAVKEPGIALPAFFDKPRLQIKPVRRLIRRKDFEFDSLNSLPERIVNRFPQERATDSLSPVAWDHTQPKMAGVAHSRSIVADNIAPPDDKTVAYGKKLA
jgi:hypothetical protein